jgi:dihydroorotate dehydrogenase
MTFSEFLAKLDKPIRPILSYINPEFTSYFYSTSRKFFLSFFTQEVSNKNIVIPIEWQRRLWDIDFNCPVFNAAGMFKTGEGYYTVAKQGAGAYLAGTTTGKPRVGNIKNGITHPFAPFPNSGAAINWMGLPNEGHEYVAKRISHLDKIAGCPIGASLGASPDVHGVAAASELTDGMKLYESAGVDFIEINESCPNVPHDSDSSGDASKLDKLLVERLEFVSKNFLKHRRRNLPVIVKFSNDTNPDQVADIVDLLVDLQFDGVNFGNTSIKYEEHAKSINSKDAEIFEFFTRTFGGGLSGKMLKPHSLNLGSIAAKIIQSKELSREFHIVRTGGVDGLSDINESEKAGISLNQWFTGYFENYSSSGHRVYQKMLS